MVHMRPSRVDSDGALMSGPQPSARREEERDSQNLDGGKGLLGKDVRVRRD